MQYIMFTKHLEGLDLDGIMQSLQKVGVAGADLCVRPGYPVTPANALKELPKAVRRFQDAGLAIPLITTPTSFTDPAADPVINLYAACGAAGVQYIKVGYWHWQAAEPYWDTVQRAQDDLQGFAALSAQHGVTTLVHNHSGRSMGLNGSAAMHLVQDFDPAQVAIFADPGHLAICGEPPDMALDIMRSHLRVCAFKDLKHRHWQQDGRTVRGSECVRMGTGLVDWANVLSTLQAFAFTGPVSFHSEYAGEEVDTVIDLARCDVRYVNALRAQL